jgi:hypothetical protein
LVKNAKGWPFYEKTALIASAEASVSTEKGLEKLGSANTGIIVIFSFNFVNIVLAAVHHVNLVEPKISVRGAARVA